LSTIHPESTARCFTAAEQEEAFSLVQDFYCGNVPGMRVLALPVEGGTELILEIENRATDVLVIVLLVQNFDPRNLPHWNLEKISKTAAVVEQALDAIKHARTRKAQDDAISRVWDAEQSAGELLDHVHSISRRLDRALPIPSDFIGGFAYVGSRKDENA
jgi:hypothetical protein